MKLLFAHDHIFIDDGGTIYSPGKLSYDSFNRYIDDFSSVTILSRCRNIDKEDNIEDLTLVSGELVNFVKCENMSTFKNRFLKRAAFKKNILNVVSEFDGVVVRVPSEIGHLVAECALELNKPYICEVVGCAADAMRGFGNLKSKLYAPVLVGSMERAVIDAFGVIYVTKSFLQSRYPSKGIMVSASNVEIEVPIEKPSYGGREKSKEDLFRIGLVGSLDSVHKGFETAYQSIAELKRLGFKVSLEVAGPGKIYRSSHILKKAGIEQEYDVKFWGSLRKKELHSWLGELDLYIQPSNQEGLPRALIEAMSKGLPAIVSRVGGMPEVIDGEFVIEANDATALANMIKSFIESPDLRISQSDINFKRSKEYSNDYLSVVRGDIFRAYASQLNNTGSA